MKGFLLNLTALTFTALKHDKTLVTYLPTLTSKSTRNNI